MAFVEVDPGPAPELGNFARFNAIGDKIAGVFQSVEETTNTFDKKQNNYTFRNREGLITVSANFDLNRKLEFAKLKPGYKVIITYVSDLASTKPGQSPMKMFRVLVDSDVSAKPAAPPPPPKPPPPAADDPFGDDIPF